MTKLKALFSSSVNVITAIVLIFTALCCSYYVKNTAADGSKYQYAAVYSMFILFTALIFILFVTASAYINRQENDRLKLIGKIIFVVFSLGCLASAFIFNNQPVTDSLFVQDKAVSMALGQSDIINDIQNGYFSRYSNNNLLVIAFSLFFEILGVFGSTNYQLASILLNCAMIIISQAMFTLAVKNFFGLKSAVKFMLISALDPVIYFTVPWVYSVSLCMPVMSGLLILISAVKKQSKTPLLIAQYGAIGVLTTLGYFIRPTAVIAVIAAAICWLFKIKKTNLLKQICGVICCVCFAAITLFGCNTLISKHYDKNNDISFPVTHWIAMGLENDGKWNADAVEYSTSFKTTEEINEANLQKISDILNQHTPLSFGKHIAKKLYATWADGTCDYELRIRQADNLNSFYNYTAGEKNDWIAVYCNAFRLALYIFSAVCLFKKFKKRKPDSSLIFTLILLGGIMFYLIWEAKESYCIPFLFSLYVLSSLSTEDVCIKKAVIKKSLLTTMTATVLIFAAFFSFWTLNGYAYKDYCVRSTSDSNLRSERPAKNQDTLVQTFATDKTFNTLELHTRPTKKGNARYEVSLYDGNKLLCSEIIGREDSSGEFTTIPIEQINPDVKTTYTLKIASVGKVKKDSFKFMCNNSQHFYGYDGELSVSGVIYPNDLKLQVYNQTDDQPYTNPLYYISFMLILLVGQLILYQTVKNKCAN